MGSFLKLAISRTDSETLYVLDNFSTGNKFAVADLDFVECDLRCPEVLRDSAGSFSVDGVFHFAAKSLVHESKIKPHLYYQNNVGGTLNLIEICVSKGIKNIVFSSTAAVYGVPRRWPITETMELRPVNVYGRSKLMVEQILRDAFAAYGISSVCLRYFNAAGAMPDGSLGEAHDPETHLIPSILKNIVNGKNEVSIFGQDYNTPDGTCIRDYVHVLDLADAHWLAMRWLSENPGSHVFNLGSGQGFSVNQIIDSCQSVTGVTLDRKILPRREGDPDVLVSSIEKAERVLGWKPRYSKLETIIGSAWAWHKNGV